MNKTRKSIINTGLNMFTVLVNLLIAIFITRRIIDAYGSDYNGVNNTVQQILNVLLVVEAGFGVSAVVALYKPIVEKNEEQIETILSTIKKVFKKIGLQFLIGSLAIIFILPLLIRSDIDYFTIVLLFAMTILPTCAKLFFTSKYICFFEARQQEYYVLFINLIGVIVIAFFSYLLIRHNASYLFIKFITMIINVLNCIAIVIFSKLMFKNIKMDKKPDYEMIKGTKDLIIGKVVSIIYSSVPIIFMSIFISSNIVSVYSVYILVIANIKNIIYAFISGPKNAIGQLLVKEDNEHVNDIFRKYNYIVVFLTALLYTITAILIMPFIQIYTINFSDSLDYIVPFFAILGILTAIFELIHIPSGTVILLTGNFRVSRNIQSISAIIMIIFVLAGIFIADEFGVLLGMLLATVILSFFEIYYAFSKIMKKNLFWFMKLLLIQFSFGIIIVFISFNYIPKVDSFIMFFANATIISIISGVLYFIINLLFFHKEIKYFSSLIIRKLKINKKIIE